MPHDLVWGPGEWALRLAVELGWPVFPCCPRSKTPQVGRIKYDGTPWRLNDSRGSLACLGGFHRATSHPDQVGEWWDRSPDANLGVRLGSYLRLGVIEGDTPAANARIEGMATAWEPTPTYRSRRGRNRVFAVPPDIPERPVRNLFESELGAGFEVKSGGGLIIVPPSVHPSGHVYAWEAGRSPLEVAVAELPAEVADAVRAWDRRHQRRATPPAPASALATLDAARVADALRYLDANDFATWIEVGLALKGTGDPAARRLWDAWSATSPKYDGDEQSRRWATFQPSRITVGSIIHVARLSGWRGVAA